MILDEDKSAVFFSDLQYPCIDKLFKIYLKVHGIFPVYRVVSLRLLFVAYRNERIEGDNTRTQN